MTERGHLESQVEIKVLCEVDDIQGDNINGTPIIWIVPNGASVKKGDLLCELDSANHTERYDRQILDAEEARSRLIQSQITFAGGHRREERRRDAEAVLGDRIGYLAQQHPIASG